MLSFIQQIKKIAKYIQAIMPTFQTRAAQLEFNTTFFNPSSTPLPIVSTFLHTRTQTN